MDKKWTTFSLEELEKQYTPSLWSKRLSADTVVKESIRVLFEGTKVAQSTLKCDLNVVYDQESGQTLDIYYPNEVKEADSSVLIFIHGGYWQELGTEHSGYLAPTFAKHGIITVAIGYDLAPKASMTTIIEQCRKGCAYIVKKFPGKRVFVSGYSAGGHLTACMFTTTDWTQYGVEQLSIQPFTGAILMNGIYDLAPIKYTSVNDPLNLTDQEIRQFSPQYTLNQIPAALKRDFSCLVTIGEHDSPEFKRQSKEYFEGLQAAGVSCTIHEIPTEDHFSLVERLVESDYSLTKLMVELIKN